MKILAMEKVTLETLPNAVIQLWQKLEAIEQLILTRGESQPTETDQLLTIKQAGQLINLSVATIYGLVSKSEIPVSKKGKRLYFSKLELIEWVKTGRKKTQAEVAAEVGNSHNRKRR